MKITYINAVVEAFYFHPLKVILIAYACYPFNIALRSDRQFLSHWLNYRKYDIIKWFGLCESL